MTIAVKSIDKLNFWLVIAACIFAHVMPIEALVFSYAFLGPAHYLTEISWLHDRQYFTKRRYDYIILISLTILVILIYDPHVTVLMFAFFLAIAMAFTANWFYRIAGAVLTTALFLWINSASLSAYFFLLLPTLVHVFVFTFFFVLLGALKSGNRYGYLTLVAMIIASASFFIDSIPSVATTQYGTENMVYMKSLYVQFSELIGIDPHSITTQKIFGFIGFAYTYHYLNWFSKTRIIGWNNISSKRLYSIIGLYIASIALYFYDYKAGFAALLLLSFIHVTLEFPLNGISIVEITKALRSKLVARLSS